MANKIIRNISFDYVIRKSARAKNMRIVIKSNNDIEVVIPQMIPKFLGKKFLEKNKLWVLRSLEKQTKIRNSEENFEKIKIEESEDFYRQKAKEYLSERVKFFIEILDIKFNKIRIKNTKTRWGSCSSQKNLNFSWKIMLAPPKVIDYLVIHEICHLKEMNHSKEFWSLVELLDPNFEEHKKWLKRHNYLLKS